MPESDVPEPTLNDVAAEAYERGLALRKAGLFKQSIEQFQKAVNDPVFVLKAYAQIGLSQKSCDRYEDAVTAFRNALKSPGASTKDIVQILYVLGRTLESLDRIAEALEAYRWLRREDPLYRDVGERIDALSMRRTQAEPRSVQNNPKAETRQQLHAWQNLLRNVK